MFFLCVRDIFSCDTHLMKILHKILLNIVTRNFISFDESYLPVENPAVN